MTTVKPKYQWTATWRITIEDVADSKAKAVFIHEVDAGFPSLSRVRPEEGNVETVLRNTSDRDGIRDLVTALNSLSSTFDDAMDE